MKRKQIVCLILMLICLYFLFFLHKKAKVILNKDFVSYSSCPYCFGTELCDELLVSSKAPHIDGTKTQIYPVWNIYSLLNVKNVYKGQFHDVKCAFKKLAHDAELEKFDQTMCSYKNNKTESCDVSEVMKEIIEKEDGNIKVILKKYRSLFDQTELIQCGDNNVVEQIWKEYDLKLPNRNRFDKIANFISSLAINPEPIFLIVFEDLNLFPPLVGSCGRLIVEGWVGPTLSALINEPWTQRVEISRQLLRLAHQISTSKLRLYLTDVTADNFAIDSDGNVRIIDAEDILIVDSNNKELKTEEHRNEGFGCQSCLSYSTEDLCSHRDADHNYYAICKGLLSSHPYAQYLPGGLLHSPSPVTLQRFPNLLPLLEQCAYVGPYKFNNGTRREAAIQLYLLLTKILSQKS